MQPYSEFRPTGFDPAGAFLHDQGDWLVVPVSRNRDDQDDPAIASNWECATRDLDKADPEFNDHEEHSFNHWGPGWFEIIIVRPGTRCAGIAEEIERALEHYPLLDEELYSRLEWEGAVAGIDNALSWDSIPLRDNLPECWDAAVLQEMCDSGSGEPYYYTAEGVHYDTDKLRDAVEILGFLDPACPECDWEMGPAVGDPTPTVCRDCNPDAPLAPPTAEDLEAEGQERLL
jgi:hypothetical protein